MPNCDWGNLCDCINCRTTYRQEICPNCKFENSVQIIGTAVWGIGRKGEPQVNIICKNEPRKDLSCFNCNEIISNIAYFDDLDVNACELTKERNFKLKNGRICTKCGAIEGDRLKKSIGRVTLTQNGDKLLCQTCNMELLKTTTPRPSSTTEKYFFNEKKLRWEPYKVKKACTKCGLSRWLNIENQWKELCLKCYRN